ncbi:FAD-dependent oxidoreductase [Bacillus cereus]
MNMKQAYTIVVIGAGTAGISLAAHLLRHVPVLKEQVAIIDPAQTHYFQPLWTFAGAGIVKKEATMKKQSDLIPEGVHWIQRKVSEISPGENRLLLEDGTIITYEMLIVAAGIQIHWDHIKGLKESIGKNGVCSNYSYDYTDATWREIQQFKGGNAIFTHPNTPIKCGGAPQKIMYLAEEYFCRQGVREKSKIMFQTANPHIFHVPRYASSLEKVIQRKQIITNFHQNLVEINAEKKEAIFEDIQTGNRESIPYHLLHVVPPMGPPDMIKNSLLGDEEGWVDINPYTLQHVRYPNIFGIGDCTNLPTSKTGAAIRKQIPVVRENLLAFLQGQEVQATYNGYTSCPIVTGYKSLILAEFDYHQEEQETFPFDQSKERYSMFLLKRYALPFLYWRYMLKGIV